MKNVLIAVLFFNWLNVIAQSKAKTDTIYYLLDTANTPLHDRMWDIHVEGPYILHTILCPCLKYNSYPQFIRKSLDKGTALPKDIISVPLITLGGLIEKAKTIINDNQTNCIFRFIEHLNYQYIVHEVAIVHPINRGLIEDSILHILILEKVKNRKIWLKGCIYRTFCS